MKQNNDLTTGKISKKLLFFTLPLLLSVICQQFYNLADSMIAGKFLGEGAFAAISNSYEITLIFMGVSVGSNIGCSVVISQLFGAKQYGKMKSAVSTSFICAIIISIVLIFVGFFSMSSLLELINTPKNIKNDCLDYLYIYISGFLFMYLYNIATGTFSSMGDSITPLIFLICSSVLNVILDLILVKYGVKGVAFATFISQMLACLASLLVLFIRLNHIEEKFEKLFSFPLLKKIASVAIPSIFQQGVISIGNIIIQAVVNDAGTAVIAGFGAAVKLHTFSVSTMMTLGNGISAFTAQNIGAQKPERVKKGFSTGIIIGAVVALVFMIPCLIFAESLISFFIDSPTDLAVRTGCENLYIVSPFYVLIAIKLVSDGVLRGSSAMKYFLIGTFADLALRVILAFVLGQIFGPIGIWCAWPLGWIFGTVCSLYGYKNGKWENKSLVK